MTLTKEKLLVALKEHKFIFSCLLCLFVSILAIKFGNISVVIYSLIVLASVFYLNITQTIALNGFGMFFYSLYDSEVLKTLFVLTVALGIKCVIMLVKKELTLKKDLIFPTSIIALITLQFFLVNFELSQIHRLLELVDCLILTFEVYLIRKHIDLTFLIRFLSLLLIGSCLMALTFGLIKIGPSPFMVDGIKIKRFYGYMTHQNWLSVWCGGLISLYLFLLLSRKVSLTESFLMGLFLTVFGYMSKSKAFLMALAILVVLYFIKSFIDNWRSALIKLLAVSLLICLVYIVFHKYFAEIISRFFAYRPEYGLLYRITTGRSRIWIAELEKLIESIFGALFGFGGSYTQILHNAYLDVFLKYGLVGTALVICFIAYFVFELKNNSNKKFCAFFPLFTILAFMFVETFTKYLFLLFIMSIFALYDFKEKEQTGKVLLYVDKLSFNTICRNVLEMTRNFAKEFEVDILVDDMQDKETAQLEKALIDCGANIYYQKTDAPIKKNIALIKFFAKHKNKYQVVHINSIGIENYFIAYYARVYGDAQKIIYHTYSSGFNDQNVLKEYLQKYFIKSYATEFASCSKKALTRMYGRTFVSKNNTIVLDLLTKSDDYYFDLQERVEMRTTLKLDNSLTALYVQDIYSCNNKKIQDILLTTVYNNPDCKFVIVGSKDYNREQAKVLSNYTLDDKARFVDNTIDLTKVVNACDVLVVPSRIECQTFVMGIAKQNNLPIVLSQNIISDYDDGETVLAQSALSGEWAKEIVSAKSTMREGILSNQNEEINACPSKALLAYYKG